MNQVIKKSFHNSNSRKYRAAVSTWFLHDVIFPFLSTFIHSLFHVLLGFCIIVPCENLNVLGALQIYGPVHRYITIGQLKGLRKKTTKTRTLRHSLSSHSPIIHVPLPCLWRMFRLYSESC